MKKNQIYIKSLGCKSGLISLCSLLVLFFASMQNAKAQDAHWEGKYIRVEGFKSQISLGSDAILSVDSIGVAGGRFAVWQNGNVGIGRDGTMSHTRARLHVSGNVIVENQVLFGTGPSIDKWLALDGSTKALWGLWLDKGVVATDYAITTPDHWADFVFDDKYQLRPLSEVERYVKVYKHLPEIPSADILKENGYTVQDMNARFMQKIEELTLYSIQQDKEIQALKKQVEELAAQMKSNKDTPVTKK